MPGTGLKNIILFAIMCSAKLRGRRSRSPLVLEPKHTGQRRLRLQQGPRDSKRQWVLEEGEMFCRVHAAGIFTRIAIT